MTCKCICCEHIDLKYSKAKTDLGFAPCRLKDNKASGNSLMERECDKFQETSAEELTRRREWWKVVMIERKRLYSTKG